MKTRKSSSLKNGTPNNGNSRRDAEPEEPVFVLRAHDRLAPTVARIWIAIAILVGCPANKCRDAERLVVEMERWAQRHGSKYPD